MAVETEKPSVAPPHGFLNIGSQSPQYLPLDNGHQQVAPVVSAPNHTIINVGGFGGGCPSCRVGVLRKSHCTFCGVLWSILLFPCGLLCLCCCTKDRCSNCSYTQN
ncbi:brain protein I3 isoform X1 [Daphnia magna]|uniref:brain protein I3 isoform X1 n=1 Tax=Daphnia magna TaxID=35525 RepID=UPI001403EAD0|nr:brain protein I3 isoform X1 [Daphnia magna]